MKNDTEFAKRLIALRKNANLSQEELGKLAGVTRQSIINYERGGAKPKFKVAAKIAQVLNVSVNYLYLGELDVVPTTIKTYKDIILNFYALKESQLFEEEVITNTNGKYQKLILTTEDPDFLNFMHQLKSILASQESLSKNTVNFAISELLDSFEIAILPKEKNPVKK